MKSPNLRHCQASSQNKGLSRASQLLTSPSPAGDRQARTARARGGNHSPREASSAKLQAGSVANQDFLGFWTVDIRREGRSQRSAPQKRHTVSLRRRTCCVSRKQSGWDRGGNKTHPLPGESALSKHLVLELLGPRKGTKCKPNRVCAFVEYLRT